MNVQKVRKERGMSRRETAKLSGMTEYRLKQIETGAATPDKYELSALADAMKVPYFALI